MRAAAMSVWVFINLLFFGMCGYLYLIWSQYWMYIEKQRFFNQFDFPQQTSPNLNNHETYVPKLSNLSRLKSNRRRSAVGVFWSSNKNTQASLSATLQFRPLTNVVRKEHGGPRFPNIHVPVLEFDTDKFICEDFTTSDCEERSKAFKELIIKEFHRVLLIEANVFKSGLDVHNQYDVKYKAGSNNELSRKEIWCALRDVGVDTVTKKDEPFGSSGFNIPLHPLQEGRTYNTCAVVTSAGALLGSGLGLFIDSHDMVLRFNNAPTENYTEDVGSKTTFRILNSQVVSKPEYGFLHNKLFSNISILAWDPSNYSSTLDSWYHHPDFPLFSVYKKLLLERPTADVHLLKPRVLWQLWGVLQDASPYRLRRNPPSSGFIGLWFSMHRCHRVRMFEYVPSARATRRCHYHSRADDAGCTLGVWHPLAQEKAVAEKLRDNSDIEVFQKGFVDIPGFSSGSLRC